MLWSQVHGEDSITCTGADCHSIQADALRSMGFTVAPLEYGSITSSILANYDILVLAYPTSSYSTSEVADIKNWVNAGGCVVTMASFENAWGVADHLNEITSEYGITFNSDTVDDHITSFAAHPITEGVGSVLFSSGCSLTLNDPAVGVGFSSTDLPVIAYSKDSGKVVAVGDANWCDDIRFYSEDNSQLSQNIFTWLSEIGPTVSISTDTFEYSPGDTMTVTLDIANPTEDSVTFEWYIGVPQLDIWVTYASAPIPAGFDNSYTIPIPVGDWGPTPFGLVHYVHMLDPVSGDVLVQDVALCAYSPSVGEAMPVDIEEEIMKTVERAELPI